MATRHKRPTMKCLVTGVEKKYSISQLKRRLRKFGSIEELQKHWISREAAAYLKKGFTVDEIRETLKVPKSWQRKVSIQVLKRLRLYKRNLIKALERNKRKNASTKVLTMEQTPSINILEFKNGKFTYPEKIKDLTRNGVCIRPDLWYAEPAQSCDNCHYAKEKYGNLCRCPTKLISGVDSEYNDMAITQLRELAAEHGLTTSGIKKTLVSRLANSVPIISSVTVQEAPTEGEINV